jgi:ADP-ribosyl-[dinitrogen reductase] hydrolase
MMIAGDRLSRTGKGMDVSREELLDRYLGVLVGGAVGDALGATVEFMDRAAIQARYGLHTEILGGGWLDLEAGEVTDDSAMAFCITSSIVDRGEFDPDDIARRFVDWYRSNPPDIGNTTRRSLEYLAQGVPWYEAGERTHVELRPRDASNGSVMRCAPVALLCRGDAPSNASHSADSSRITHANPLAVDGCVALNAAIAALLDEPDCDPVQSACQAATTTEVREAIAAAPGLSRDDLDAGGYVLSTLQSAFWAVTTHGSLEEAIVAAVNLGQDADTTGAVAGGLAGAKWGFAAIPSRWRRELADLDYLLSMAEGLLDLSLARH